MRHIVCYKILLVEPEFVYINAPLGHVFEIFGVGQKCDFLGTSFVMLIKDEGFYFDHAKRYL